MEERSLEIDSFVSQLDNWKGLVLELELLPNEEHACAVSKMVLVGKIIFDTLVRLGVVRLAFATSLVATRWLSSGLCFYQHFPFHIQIHYDRDRVWDHRTWTVKGAHLALKQWDPNLALEDIDFTWSTFWVQVYGLPLKFMNQ